MWTRASIAVALASATAILLAPAAPAATPGTAGAPPQSQAATPLDRYLEHLRTLRVTFLQTVADSHGAEVGRSSGTLIVERPGKFRWDIHPEPLPAAADAPASAASGAASTAEGGQLMVSDGRNLWYFDRDLEQVTVRPVTAALSATPAMLLSGTVDVHQHFTEKSVGPREGLGWVYVEPRSAQADFNDALFGFDSKGTLQRMILEDKLGQTVTIIFQDVAVNVPVPPREFVFTPPPGADVIGTPAQ
ncbi:MAG: outer-membrane lipoprotein carrier protein LolA [Steroidobacteraceae bacterium]